jgi:hypothetical protein
MEKEPIFWATLLFCHRRESEIKTKMTLFRTTMCFLDMRINEKIAKNTALSGPQQTGNRN